MSLFHSRKKTSRRTRSHHTVRRGADIQKLYIKVNSPRIVMIQVMSGIGKGIKLALALAMIGAIGWGGYKGVKHVFVDNPKYKLREIKLVTNGHLNEARVVEVAEIDINSSIFAIDVDHVRNELKALPEVIDCKVKHRLPGTLIIKITERVPVVWLECEKLNFPGRTQTGLLADKNGITFPCEGSLWDTSQELPVIVIQDATQKDFVHGTKMKHKDAIRALNLILRFNQQDIPNEWMPERIVLLNDFSMEAICNNNARATFGMYDHERQMNDLLTIYHHTQETDRVINHVNLIPKKNIPVTFAGGPVLVRPQHHPSPANPHDRQIQSILDRD